MRGSLELSQGRGGIWGYMEKSTALKKESMTGFQVDAKLQRLIVGYENLCADGKVPTKDVHGFLVHQLDRARGIINKSPNRTSPKKLLEEINLLNKDLSTILEKWNF